MTLYRETLCVHERAEKHRISDVMCSVGYCRHEPIHSLCNGRIREVVNPDKEKATKALRRFVEAFEGEEVKPYGSAVDVVLDAALGSTEEEW